MLFNLEFFISNVGIVIIAIQICFSVFTNKKKLQVFDTLQVVNFLKEGIWCGFTSQLI